MLKCRAFSVGCLKPPAGQEGAWSAVVAPHRCFLLSLRYMMMAQQQDRAVQHVKKHSSDSQVPGLPLQPWVKLGFLLVTSWLPWEDLLSNLRGMIQTCNASHGPTEATKFMIKPSQIFPKSGGLDMGFKPIVVPELENCLFFSSLPHFLSLVGFGGFWWLELNPNPSIANSFTPESPNMSLMYRNILAHTQSFLPLCLSAVLLGVTSVGKSFTYSTLNHTEKRSTSLISQKERDMD